MNYSEQLALHYLERTRVLMADASWLDGDWPSAMFTLALGLLVFLILIVAAESRAQRTRERRRHHGAAARRWTSTDASRSRTQ